MIVLYGRMVNSSNYSSNHNSNKDSHHSNLHKDDIINAAKVAAKKSILMQITARAKAANGFH
jgi:hypothetical protein